ncbi:MAG: hypothetical protein EA398_10885 [Deltaproteobacteria bacterium]|nr:MAG: hypothetical protein EA398_10885 [Deltaproteobacteria bacterium]
MTVTPRALPTILTALRSMLSRATPLAAALLMLLGVALTGCGNPAEDAGPGGRCERPGDCPVGFACSTSGACVPAAGAACSPDEPCPNGYFCNQDNACQAIPAGDGGEICNRSTDCDTTTVCLAGRCRTLECTGDIDCPIDSRCLGTICRAAPPCASDATCGPTGWCEDGRCNPGCENNAGCGGTSLFRCMDNRCAATCGGDGECSAGERCRDGVCTAEECSGFGAEGCPDGQRCDGDGRCIDAVACSSSESCTPEEHCVDGFCEPRIRCRADVDCDGTLGQFCRNNACATPPPCDPDAPQCPSGQSCIAGWCLADGCLDDTECVDTERCDLGRCRSRTSATAESLRIVPLDIAAPSRSTSIRLLVLPADADGRPIPGTLPALRVEVDPPGALRVVTSANSEEISVQAGETPGPARLRVQLADAPDISGEIALTPRPAVESNTITVLVHDADTLMPVDQALVRIGDRSRTTDPSGVATFPAPTEDPTEPTEPTEPTAIPSDAPPTEGDPSAPDEASGEDGSQRSTGSSPATDPAPLAIEIRAPGHVPALMLLPPDTRTVAVPLRNTRRQDIAFEASIAVADPVALHDAHGALALAAMPTDPAHLAAPHLLGPVRGLERALPELGDPDLHLPETIYLELDFLGIGPLRTSLRSTARPLDPLVVLHASSLKAETLLDLFRVEQSWSLVELMHEHVTTLTRPDPHAAWISAPQESPGRVTTEPARLNRRLVSLPPAEPAASADSRHFVLLLEDHPLHGWIPTGLERVEAGAVTWVASLAPPRQFRGRAARLVVLSWPVSPHEGTGLGRTLPLATTGLVVTLEPGQRTVDLADRVWPVPVEAWPALEEDRLVLTAEGIPATAAVRTTLGTGSNRLEVWWAPGIRSAEAGSTFGVLEELPSVAGEILWWDVPEEDWERRLSGNRGGLSGLGRDAAGFAHRIVAAP